MKAFLTKNVAFGQHFSTKLLVTANTFKPKYTQNLGLFPRKSLD